MPHVEMQSPAPVESDAPFSAVRLRPSRTEALVRAHAANDAAGFGFDAPGALAEGPALEMPAENPAVARSIARRPSSRALHRMASRMRSRLIGEAFVAALEAIPRLLRRARDAWRTRQRIESTRSKLGELDDRMLRDLGLDRSEIASLGAEIGGRADATRVHALLAAHGVWR